MNRPGFDLYFPPSDYIMILKFFNRNDVIRYKDIQKKAKIKHDQLGSKIVRMKAEGLIERPAKKRGMYQITNFGCKVLKAYELYKEALK